MLQLSEANQLFTGLMVLTALFLVTTGVLVFNSHMVGIKAKRGFLACIGVLVVVVAVDWFTVATDGMLPVLSRAHTFATALEFSLAPFVPVIIAHALMPKSRAKYLYIPLALHAAFEFASCVTGWSFWVDDADLYHRGDWYWVYMAFYVATSLYLIGVSLRAGRHYQVRGNQNMLAIVTCLSAGVLIQVFFPKVHICWAAVAMAILLYFTYYCDMVQQTDALTMLLNRRSYETHIERPHLPCVVVSLDLDDFKRANDTFGHGEGDECLTTAAALIRQVFGPTGYCYRVGGDEFCVIMTRRLASVGELAYQLERTVEEARADDPRLTDISIGWAEANAGCTDFPAVIAQADQAMYANKRARKAAR